MTKNREKHLAAGKKKIGGEAIITVILVLLLSFAAIATGIALPGLASELQSRSIEKTFKLEALNPDMLRLKDNNEEHSESPEIYAELPGEESLN